MESTSKNKPGYKTTEFWITLVTSVATFMNQSGFLGSFILPVEAIGSIAAIVIGYSISRGTSKKSV